MIQRQNRSCAVNRAPCVVSAASDTSKVVAHATTTVGGGVHKVLLARKTATPAEKMPVEVCGVFGGATAARTSWLRGSAGLATTADHGVLTLGGRTLQGSADGEWIGERVEEVVTADPQTGCFALQLAPFEAVLLTIP